MPRQPRYDLPGLPQHVIQRGNNRQAVFFEEDDCVRYLEDLDAVAKQVGVATHAYVLMTNHVHLLVGHAQRKRRDQSADAGPGATVCRLREWPLQTVGDIVGRTLQGESGG